MNDIQTMGKLAKAAERQISGISAMQRNQALSAIANALIEKSAQILVENQKDLAAAKANNMSESMQDRLLLTRERIIGIADAVKKLVDMEDCLGTVESGTVRPNGLRITKVRVPLGIIGIIFESRPNVTVDAATLCLKAGNVVILRGGKEAIYSNTCLMNIMRDAVASVGLPKDCMQLVEDTSRQSSVDLMHCQDLDVLIPRGGAGLIRAVVENATVPVIETGTGNCHIYVDASADLEMAVNILNNAKTQRPSVCNAAESCLVHKDIAEQFLPMAQKKLQEHNVTLLGCPRTMEILGNCVSPATEEDYATEFLDYTLSVKVVEDMNEAIQHIATYSTGHSECIVTRDYASANQFQQQVDAAAVYVNASTRFTDGGEFGFGAEIGISTQKLHARGPMGLKELTTTKYLICGDGQIR